MFGFRRLFKIFPRVHGTGIFTIPFNHKHQSFMSVNIPLDPMGVSIIIATWRIFPRLLVSVVSNPHLEAMDFGHFRRGALPDP